MGLGIIEHSGCRAFHIGYGKHRRLALEVSHDKRSRVLLLQLDDGLYRELLVYVASAVPQQHVSARDAVDIVAKIVVGTEDNLLVLGEGSHHLLGVARCNDTIGKRLDGCSGVDVAHHLVAGMLVLKLLEVLGAARVGKRAASGEVGTQHGLVGRQELTGFSHEVNAAHHHNLGVGLGSLASQCERVAHKVGNVLDVAHGVVVCENYSVLLLAEVTYLLLQIQGCVYLFVDISFLNPLFLHIYIVSCFSFPQHSILYISFYF